MRAGAAPDAPPDGWTAERQRDFIRLLATYGSPRLACEAMGKNVSGIASIYKRPDAESFRAAWDKALAIGLARQARPSSEPHFAQAPGLAPRQPHNRRAQPIRGIGEHGDRPDQPEISEDQKWDLIHTIGIRFMRKVAAERQARLAGEIVAADF